ncbi:HigA family addiction module antitoxin [Oligoflexia bacterium]|nr:HigA family addiction module antitoxin [Oligoflexia bacterium]
MARMFNPPHPGEILREDYLLPLRITQREFAEHISVTRKTVSAIVNERSGISPDMAVRFAHAFDTTPEFWLNLQISYDLWQVESSSKELRKIKKIEGTEAA